MSKFLKPTTSGNKYKNPEKPINSGFSGYNFALVVTVFQDMRSCNTVYAAWKSGRDIERLKKLADCGIMI